MDVRSKKLYKDMTKDERLLIEYRLENIHIKHFTRHTLDRMREKDISKFDILNVLRSYSIIEINHKEGTNPRVLLRGNIKDNRGYCTCISLDLISHKVITTYKNYSRDRHRTLDYNRYSNTIKIKDILIQNN